MNVNEVREFVSKFECECEAWRAEVASANSEARKLKEEVKRLEENCTYWIKQCCTRGEEVFKLKEKYANLDKDCPREDCPVLRPAEAVSYTSGAAAMQCEGPSRKCSIPAVPTFDISDACVVSPNTFKILLGSRRLTIKVE